MNWGENWRVTVAAILTLFIAPPLAHDAFSRGAQPGPASGTGLLGWLVPPSSLGRLSADSMARKRSLALQVVGGRACVRSMQRSGLSESRRAREGHDEKSSRGRPWLRLRPSMTTSTRSNPATSRTPARFSTMASSPSLKVPNRRIPSTATDMAEPDSEPTTPAVQSSANSSAGTGRQLEDPASDRGDL